MAILQVVKTAGIKNCEATQEIAPVHSCGSNGYTRNFSKGSWTCEIP
jgi:hypothetical protein